MNSAKTRWTPLPVPPEYASANDVDTTMSSIPDDELLRRAVHNARARQRGGHARREAVMHVFALGSGFSAQLCKRFGLDPYEVAT